MRNSQTNAESAHPTPSCKTPATNTSPKFPDETRQMRLNHLKAVYFSHIVKNVMMKQLWQRIVRITINI